MKNLKRYIFIGTGALLLALGVFLPNGDPVLGRIMNPQAVGVAPAVADLDMNGYDLTDVGSATLGTTTTSMLNGVIYVNGTNYARTDDGINKAITDCSADASCKRVHLSAGSYSIAGSVGLTNNLTLSCDGWGTQLNMSNSGTSVNIDGKQNVTIRDCYFDQSSITSGVLSSNKTIFINDSHDVLIDHVRVKDAYSFGVFIRSSSDVNASTSRVTVKNSYLNGRGNADVIGGGPADSTSTVRNIIIENNTVVQDATLGNNYEGGIDLVRANEYTIKNNNSYGFIALAVEQHPNVRSIVESNVVHPAYGKTCGRIELNSTSATTTSTMLGFHNNILENSYLKLESPLVNGVVNLSSVGNTINATGCTYGIVLTNVKGSTITGYTIYGSTVGVRLFDSSYNIIEGVIHDTTYGVSSSGTSNYNSYQSVMYGVTTEYVTGDTNARSKIKGELTVSSSNDGTSLWTSPTTTQVAIGASSVNGDASLYVVRSSGEGTVPVAGGTIAQFISNAASGYSSRVSIISGTAGTASLSFGDKDSDTSGALNYSNVTNSFYFTGGGNVGISTTSPATKLDVYNATATSSAYIYSGGAGLGGRLILEDTNGSTCTQITTLAGVITAAAVACP